MSLKVPVLMLLAAVGSASAFTLNFSSLASGTIVPATPGSLSLAVPGYGNVSISSALGSALEIATISGQQAVNMNGGEALVVNFGGPTPTDVSFNYVGVNTGESFASMAPLSANQYIVSFTGNNAGVSGVNFTATAAPEPTAALLGAMGSLLLFRRRRN